MRKTMNYVWMGVVAVLALSPAARAFPRAQQQEVASTGKAAAFVGSDLFRSYCATCHGEAAKGDGPLASMLKKRPADLTMFSKNNGGTFPAELVGRIIDGRKQVDGHGGKDMPVWGDAFKEAGGGSDEAAIKARIDALVRYLETIQVK
ncbi:c-type cytochrome [Luteitalea sp. TBR-22]|uniref:c-type cytochrome n=1 Tax=Luteitalea sp. TBR-22 TaxID=2802971 RepID=UPI001EF43E73|nr:c-type cytochrome [Luteitalea sp. TBR-22]